MGLSEIVALIQNPKKVVAMILKSKVSDFFGNLNTSKVMSILGALIMSLGVQARFSPKVRGWLKSFVQAVAFGGTIGVIILLCVALFLKLVVNKGQKRLKN